MILQLRSEGRAGGGKVKRRGKSNKVKEENIPFYIKGTACVKACTRVTADTL